MKAHSDDWQHAAKKWVGDLAKQHQARAALEAEYLALTGRVIDWQTPPHEWGTLALEYSYPDRETADLGNDTVRLRMLMWIVAYERRRQQQQAAPEPDRNKQGAPRGRLNKAESKAKRTHMMATLRQHPSLRDDPGELADKVGVSVKTIHRWLEDEHRKYLDSAAAKPEPWD